MKFAKIAMMAAAIGLFTTGTSIQTVNAASHEKHASVMVKDAWARARTPKAKVGGAFMMVHNMGKEDDRLVSAKSKIAERTEIHTTEMTNGVMKMLQVKEGIEVKAGKMVALKPGSYHVMFLGLKEPVTEGKTFPVTLVFEKAGEVEVMVSVKKAGAMGNMNHGKMDHEKMEHGENHDQMKKMKKTN